MTPEQRIAVLEQQVSLLKQQLELDRREWHAAIARAMDDLRREQQWREYRREVSA